MEEIETFFTCPYCFETISMLLDASIYGKQSYVEDCEVCCNPIQITYQSEDDAISDLTAEKAYE